MTMSTQTLAEASRRLAQATLKDTVQIYDVAAPVTVGPNVTRALTAVGQPVAGLVQTDFLNNSIDGTVTTLFSIKVSQGTPLHPGQAVRVVTCLQEPALVGMTLIVDSVSFNGAAMLRKAMASKFDVVNQEGKDL